MTWAEWMATADHTVAKTDVTTEVGKFHVSTVFLGLDYDFFGGGCPILFETMVFDSVRGRDIRTRRYSTLDEALAGHEEGVGEVQRLEVWPIDDRIEELEPE